MMIDSDYDKMIDLKYAKDWCRRSGYGDNIEIAEIFLYLFQNEDVHLLDEVAAWKEEYEKKPKRLFMPLFEKGPEISKEQSERLKEQARIVLLFEEEMYWYREYKYYESLMKKFDNIGGKVNGQN